MANPDTSMRTVDRARSIPDIVGDALDTDSIFDMVQQDGKVLYRPLKGTDAMRVLALQPTSSYSAELRGTLLETTISECDRDIIDSFTALSYVWGNPIRKNYIRVGGIVTAITASLDPALRELRDNTRVLRMWADALCIDQSNIRERNQQVSLIGYIYATARNTIIHLGPSTPEAESVLAELLFRTSITQQMSETTTRLDIASQRDLELIHEHILTRPWFRRVWVLQELVLSKDPWLQCGAIRVRWKDFCLIALDIKNENLGKSGVGISSWTLLKNMNDIRLGATFDNASPDMHHHHQINRTLFSVLNCRRGLGATDPRDVVFAHLSVTSDHGSINNKKTTTIQVNYQNSCIQVFAQLAIYIINEKNHTDTVMGKALQELINLCGDPNPDERIANLPSWVQM
jgi:hypothetical protein